MFDEIRKYAFGFAVHYNDPTLTHMVSGGEASVDGCSPRSLGAVVDGVSGSVVTLCGSLTYGVLGRVCAGPLSGLCVDCVTAFESQGRHVIPDGWTSGERDAYWHGFDRGAQYCAFMHVYHADAFGDEAPMIPWHIGADDALKSRFEEGVLDGARAFGATLTRVAARV